MDQFIKELPNSSNFNQTSFIFDKLAFIVESVRPLLQYQPQSIRKRPRVDSNQIEEPSLPKRMKMDAAYTTIINNTYGDVPIGQAEVRFSNSMNFFC